MEYNKLIDICIDEEIKKVVLQRIFRYGQEKAHVESIPSLHFKLALILHVLSLDHN